MRFSHPWEHSTVCNWAGWRTTLGFELQPCIQFVAAPQNNKWSFIPTANTCSATLFLPKWSYDLPLPTEEELFEVYFAFSESEEWSSQLIFQFKQLERRSLKKIRTSTVEVLIFFRLLLSNCLNWKINCDDHSSLTSTTTVHIWIISYKLHIFVFSNS